jgi:putative hydrolase of the HAD superfamily
LADHLRRIPVPRYVFTNATRRYAGRVLETLGVSHLFSSIFDIEFSLLNPKPSPVYYERVVRALGLPPDRIGLVDDSPRNLPPGLAMGMRCVCVGDRGETPPGAMRVASFAEVPDALGF